MFWKKRNFPSLLPVGKHAIWNKVCRAGKKKYQKGKGTDLVFEGRAQIGFHFFLFVFFFFTSLLRASSQKKNMVQLLPGSHQIANTSVNVFWEIWEGRRRNPIWNPAQLRTNHLYMNSSLDHTV